MKKLKVLMIFDCPGVPEDYDFKIEFKHENWTTEASVKKALKALGHEVHLFGIGDNIDLVGKKISNVKPDLLFNLTEVFHGKVVFEKNLPSYFELQNIPYSGCSAAGLMLCRNKALSKKILKYHKIKVPHFQVFRKGGRKKPLRKLKFPMLIKPLQEQASIGIAQSSFVKNEAGLYDRVKFIHEKLNMHAIAEEFIEGRELYVGVLGYKKLKVFPPREMVFTKVPDEDPKIATYKAKWDKSYRKKWGINNIFANEIPEDIGKKIFSVCKRAYRALNIGGYCRLDIRLTPDNDIYIIEANANPALADSEDFALAAKKAGIPYELLITKIINLAFNREYE
jgi:D-alanine-D-alanine ligase